jgi:hypothetical protein
MTGNIRDAALKISLIDDVSKPARSVAQALKDAEARVKDIAKAMSNMGATDRLQKSLSQLKLSKADIESVAKAWQDYAKASNLASDSSKWTVEQARAVKAWEAQTVRSLREVKREQQVFFRAQAQAEKKAAEAARKPGVFGHVMNHVAGQTAMIAAGGAVEHAVKTAVEQAADAEQLRFRIRELSRNNPAEARLADDLAAEIAAKYPSVTTGKALDNYIELRANSVGANGLVDPAVARRNAFAAARAQNAALALGFDMTPEDMQNLLKGVESSGRANDPKAVEKITDAYLRAKQVFGTAIASSMLRDYVANAKSANFSIGDDQFYRANFVRMSEGNASRLGNEVNQTLATLAGGNMKKAAGEWLVELGLAKASDMEKTGGGNVRFKHGVKDHDLLETNQGRWAATTLKEAMERHGVLADDKVAARMKMLREQELKSNPNAQIDERFLRERAEEGLISAHLARAGFRTTVSDNLAHFIGNERLIERDSHAMDNASGLEAGERIGQNPVASFKELTASLANFATVVGGPAMRDVGGILDSASKSIASFSKTLSDWQKDNPLLGKAASWGALGAGGAGGLALLYGGLQGLSSGFGLKGSAVALDGSAAALMAAAEKQGFNGIPKPGGMPGGPGGASAEGRVGTMPFLWGRLALGAYGAYEAAANIPTTPEEWKKRGEANDQLQAAVGDWVKNHLPSFLFPDKGLLEKYTNPDLLSAGAARAQAAGAQVDSAALDAAKQKADEANQAKNQLAEPVAINLDSSSVAALVEQLQKASSLLASINAGVSHAAHGLAPLGKTSQGHFGLSGIHGG